MKQNFFRIQIRITIISAVINYLKVDLFTESLIDEK